MRKVAMGVLVMLMTVVLGASSASSATTVTGTVEQVEPSRVEVQVVDAHGKATGKPVWFAMTATTKVTRGGKTVALADAKLKAGETVTILINAGDEAATDWTCPMHPEVAESKAGTCPKCGMALKARVHPAKVAELRIGGQ